MKAWPSIAQLARFVNLVTSLSSVICPRTTVTGKTLTGTFAAGALKDIGNLYWKYSSMPQTMSGYACIFAHHLRTSASTVRKWEQGESRPADRAIKLLNVIADKGLQAII